MLFQERQGLWLPKDDRTHPHGHHPPFVLLRDIHDGLLAKYDCKDSAPPPAQPGARARPARDSQDGASQQEAAPLFLPRLDRLYEANLRGKGASKVTIPAQKTLKHQILSRAAV